jgi:hypothetical protein
MSVGLENVEKGMKDGAKPSLLSRFLSSIEASILHHHIKSLARATGVIYKDIGRRIKSRLQNEKVNMQTTVGL